MVVDVLTEAMVKGIHRTEEGIVLDRIPNQPTVFQVFEAKDAGVRENIGTVSGVKRNISEVASNFLKIAV